MVAPIQICAKRRRSPDNPSEQDLLDLTTPNRVICSSGILEIFSINHHATDLLDIFADWCVITTHLKF